MRKPDPFPMPTAWCNAAVLSFANVMLMLFFFAVLAAGPGELGEIWRHRVGPLSVLGLSRLIGALFLAYAALEMFVTWRRTGPGQPSAWVRYGAAVIFLAGYQVALLLV